MLCSDIEKKTQDMAVKSFKKTKTPLKRVYKTEKVLSLIKEKDSKYWKRELNKRSMELFSLASTYVPAYKDFLKKNKVKKTDIQTHKDWDSVPVLDKKNYLRKYPLEDLCWDGNIDKPLVFTSTSGSTGEPMYFPRGSQLDEQASIFHELFFNYNSKGKKNDKPTLVLVCFGMGVWIGGLITYQSFKIMAENDYPVSIITPGINKEEIFKALKNVAPHYEQTIIAGYAPFIKDIVDEAPGRGINIKKLNPRFIFAAEAFTESFRDYIVKKAGITNPYLDTTNIYGSADIGAMSFETPFSIFIRRRALKNKKLFQDIFGDIKKTPTLTQFNPQFIQFEENKGEILLSGNNSIPLVRYDIGDNGGVLSFDEVVEKFSNYGIDIVKEAKKEGLKDFIWELPFVYVYERKDFSTTLYGLQIYPEPVKETLIKSPLNKYLTGKFTMATRYDKNQDQYLEINVELRKGIDESSTLENQIQNLIYQNLRVNISEYKELSNFLKERSKPRIVHWPAEHPTYFKMGIKQKWVDKDNGNGKK